jgi:hypothetical protein
MYLFTQSILFLRPLLRARSVSTGFAGSNRPSGPAAMLIGLPFAVRPLSLLLLIFPIASRLSHMEMLHAKSGPSGAITIDPGTQ